MSHNSAMASASSNAPGIPKKSKEETPLPTSIYA